MSGELKEISYNISTLISSLIDGESLTVCNGDFILPKSYVSIFPQQLLYMPELLQHLGVSRLSIYRYEKTANIVITYTGDNMFSIELTLDQAEQPVIIAETWNDAHSKFNARKVAGPSAIY
ncbi:MAG: hypothetical protein ACJAYB_000027 [Psychromonas sp.]|jgi:hypothetical protein